MLKNLIALFDQYSPKDVDSPYTTINLASAALLIEVALADGNFCEAEQRTIESLLQHSFNIPEDIIEGLISTAQSDVQHSVDHYQFTKHITAEFDYPSRCQLIAALWTLAYADNQLDVMEEHRIRRLCDLLTIDHSDFIRLKIEARDKQAP